MRVVAKFNLIARGLAGHQLGEPAELNIFQLASDPGIRRYIYGRRAACRGQSLGRATLSSHNFTRNCNYNYNYIFKKTNNGYLP